MWFMVRCWVHLPLMDLWCAKTLCVWHICISNKWKYGHLHSSRHHLLTAQHYQLCIYGCWAFLLLLGCGSINLEFTARCMWDPALSFDSFEQQLKMTLFECIRCVIADASTNWYWHWPMALATSDVVHQNKPWVIYKMFFLRLLPCRLWSLI